MGAAFVTFEGDRGEVRVWGIGEGLGVVTDEEGEGLEGGFQWGEDRWRWHFHGWRLGGFDLRLGFRAEICCAH